MIGLASPSDGHDGDARWEFIMALFDEAYRLKRNVIGLPMAQATMTSQDDLFRQNISPESISTHSPSYREPV